MERNITFGVLAIGLASGAGFAAGAGAAAVGPAILAVLGCIVLRSVRT